MESDKTMELHEGCARRGGVCDCAERPCAVAFKEQWFAEMREHSIPEEKITELWEAGRRAGHHYTNNGQRGE